MSYGDVAKRKLFSNCQRPMDRIMIDNVVGKYRDLLNANKKLDDKDDILPLECDYIHYYE